MPPQSHSVVNKAEHIKQVRTRFPPPIYPSHMHLPIRAHKYQPGSGGEAETGELRLTPGGSPPHQEISSPYNVPGTVGSAGDETTQQKPESLGSQGGVGVWADVAKIHPKRLCDVGCTRQEREGGASVGQGSKTDLQRIPSLSFMVALGPANLLSLEPE